MRTQYKIFVYSFAVLLIIIGLLVLPISTSALSLGSKPFGGRVQYTFYCDCSFNTLVYVGPPRGGVFIFDYSTRLYGYYNVSAGRWVLGLAANETTYGCYVVVGDYCELYDSAPPMKMVGTSQ